MASGPVKWVHGIFNLLSIQEFFQVIEGLVRLHESNTQHFVEIKAGEAGIIPPGFTGKFEVVEAVRKYFVVVEV